MRSLAGFLLSLACAPFSLLGAATAQAVECSHVESQGKLFTVCKADARRDQLRLFLNDASGEPYKSFDALARSLSAKGELLDFAMNAGMYHPDFSAVGLYVSEGSELSPLSTASGKGNFFLKPNGVFYINAQGYGIAETDRYARMHAAPQLASQSGPMLLIEGKVHPAFIPDSTSRLLRNGVGIVSPHEAVFVISDGPVNFYEFALFFRDVLGCKDALYFDGNISSLHSTQMNRSDALHPLGPIIGITQTLAPPKTQ